MRRLFFCYFHLNPNKFVPLQQERLNQLFFFTTNSSSSSSQHIYARLMRVVDRRVSVIPMVEQWWAEQGRSVLPKSYIQGLVKQLKRSKRHVHALQISMWMSDQRHFPLSPGDLSDRLNLIYRVHGLEHVENYFNNIPKQKKVYQTYGALLKCYAEEKSVEKAEALFEQMKQLEMLTSFSYNVLMRLYTDSGQHEKVGTLFQEMNNNGVRPDTFTDYTLLEAYATALNISMMEGVMKRIKRLHLEDSHKYAIVARAYAKKGLQDKALAALKKSEKLVPGKNGRIAWGFLITMYSDIGNKDEMYRIWNTYRSSSQEASNSVYMCMISGLLKLNDPNAAEALFKEWESQFTYYDMRVPSILISYYCKKGFLRKAKSLLWKTVGSGRTPFANSWARVAAGYFKVNHIPEAVKMMKAAMEAGKPSWSPSPKNVIKSLEYFGEKKDLRGAEEFVKLVRQLVPLTREVYHCLLRTYSVAGEPLSDVLEQMKEDGFHVDEETNKILRSCRIRLVS
ncbi:pentatricopeptide repeat-containing protein-like, mitochondrial [Iris pallida]|uniref:Pentatricopeptide repeat-containing protein-like, mitochondrial n=1 Tax=Iris pallida TaxID=29817 RepID=A0AAX6I020_IRIPA|nr:pentatricopeptide repeat-containing protein-like, mitochondrial [Iris pallida]